MNTRKSITCLLAALLFAACSNDDIAPDVPDTPTVGRHLRLGGSAGNDNAATRASWTDNNNSKLTFAWEYSDPDATTSELKMAFIKDGVFLNTIEGKSVTENKYRSFVLDGELLKTANDNGVYNWVSGKSYTIRMSLSDILSFDGITVNDWTEKDINGGVAEENSSTDI